MTANFKEVGAEVDAICDVYEPNWKSDSRPRPPARNRIELQAAVGEQVHRCRCSATDHWHAQMTIDAVEAGKDVYVEKPMVHKIDEGFRVIEAVRRTKRVVQVGMQRRSYDVFQEAKQSWNRARSGGVRWCSGGG